jgi:PEP-CTERM/exosortase A-associated glycosyltransferase
VTSPRVLHVLDHSIPVHSGYGVRTLCLLEQSRARGWQTFHLTGPKQNGCTLPKEDVDGWRFYRTPPVGAGRYATPALRALALMRALERRIEAVATEVKPDLLHAHSPVLNALPAQRVARRLGLPMVYEVRAFWEDAAVDHGTTREGSLRYRLTRRLETHALRRADAVITICEGLEHDIVARGIPARKVTVVPNAVDVEGFSVGGRPDAALERALGLEGGPVIGFIGSFYAYEGLALLVDALPRMLERRPTLRLLLVGGGPEESTLRARAASLGVSERVLFVGRVPHADIRRYYDLIDVLCYPRMPMRLTHLVTPLKPLEAMAQGRLVVASDVGGHRELIRDGETGVLFRAGDVEDCAASVLAVLDRSDGGDSLRRQARSFVEAERTWASSIARCERVYRSLLDAVAA